jgi:hypothetical protein
LAAASCRFCALAKLTAKNKNSVPTNFDLIFPLEELVLLTAKSSASIGVPLRLPQLRIGKHFTRSNCRAGQEIPPSTLAVKGNNHEIALT